MTDAPVDGITVNEAFHMLIPSIPPNKARVSLKVAIAAGDVTLRANDEPVRPDWFEAHLTIDARSDDQGKWTAELAMLKAVNNFYEIKWTVSRAEVVKLCTAIKRHPGGSPREHDHDDVRAAAVIALLPYLKKGDIPKTYSGNDLAADVRVILGDSAPGNTLLKDILNPFLTRIRNRLAGR